MKVYTAEGMNQASAWWLQQMLVGGPRFEFHDLQCLVVV
jgi:hypothetical protein